MYHHIKKNLLITSMCQLFCAYIIQNCSCHTVRHGEPL
nr:MAG TPA: hypothetical protein [Caudoviricetes sp.]